MMTETTTQITVEADPLEYSDVSVFETAVSRTLNRLVRQLNQAGLDKNDIAMMDIMISDMGQFQVFNGIYEAFFESDFPARAVVSTDNLRKHVPLRMTATIAGPGDANKIISTDLAPKPVGAYVQGRLVGTDRLQTAYISGQIPLDPVTGKLDQDSCESAAKRVVKHVEVMLMATRLNIEDVALTIYLTDQADRDEVESIIASNLPQYTPSLRYQLATQLPKGSRIEIVTVATGVPK